MFNNKLKPTVIITTLHERTAQIRNPMEVNNMQENRKQQNLKVENPSMCEKLIRLEDMNEIEHNLNSMESKEQQTREINEDDEHVK